MILDVQPIADVQTIAVNGQSFFSQTFDDHMGNELLGKMIGTVVVRAVSNNCRQLVSFTPCPNQMIGGSLACGVGGVGGVRAGFGEKSFPPQGTKHFVCRDMQETKSLADRLVQLSPIRSHIFEDRDGSQAVVVDDFSS